MPENFIQPVTDRQVCFNCQRTVTGKKKLSKCSRCHAITYCGVKCQKADWPRHAWNCIPVMVTEFEGKGRGVVAARDIKMGEFIFKDKPAIKLPKNSLLKRYSDKIVLNKTGFNSLMKQIDNLPSEAKLQFHKLKIGEKIGGFHVEPGDTMREKEIRIFLENANETPGDKMMLFLNLILINHSCAPNADFEPDEEGECVVRAIRDISKGEEVTLFYKTPRTVGPENLTYKRFGCNVKERMKVIKDQFGFDCKCCVCSGVVPDQEDIIKELLELHETLQLHSEGNMSIFLQTIDKIVDLNLRLYIGSLDDTLWVLEIMLRNAYLIQDEDRLEKAKKQFKKIAEETNLKNVIEVYEKLMTYCEKK